MAKNCTELLEINLNTLNTLRLKENKICVILDNLVASSVHSKSLEEKNSKWKVSYVSGLTFDENKRGFLCSPLTEPIVLPAVHLVSRQQHRLLHTWYAKALRSHHMSIRTFKSQRSVKLELEQNPSFVNRVKKWLGLSSNVHMV